MRLRTLITTIIHCLALIVFMGDARAANCTVSAVGPNFGVYDPLRSSDTPANGSVTVSCTLTAPILEVVSIVASYSTGSSGSYSARSMRSGANQLFYNLYLDAALTQICGNDTGGSQTSSNSLTLWFFNPQQSVTRTIYGNATKLQDVTPGSYGDTITVTVTY
jgi:spore coat protein U-like protein